MADVAFPVEPIANSRILGARISAVHTGLTVNIAGSVGQQAKPLIQLAPFDVVRFEVAVVEGGTWGGAVLQVYYTIAGYDWYPVSGATISANGIMAAVALEAAAQVTLQLVTAHSSAPSTVLVQVAACLTDAGRVAVS